MQPTTTDVRARLRHVLDPELGRDIVSLGLVREVECSPEAVRITLVPTSAACPLTDVLRRDAAAAVQQAWPDLDVSVAVVAPGRRGRLPVVEPSTSGAAPPGPRAWGDWLLAPARSAVPVWLRPIAAIGAAVALSSGLMAGLARLGLPMPAAPVDRHGALLVGAFFGTVIGLERALAVRSPASVSTPLLAAASGVALLALPEAGPPLALLASLAFLATTSALAVRQPAAETAVGAAGALAWAIASAAWWAGVPAGAVAPLWASFLVLTILGERVELGRLDGGRDPGRIATTAALAVVIGAALPLARIDLRGPWAVALLIATAVVARGDPAPRALGRGGIAAYAAAALTAGYAWLIAGALLLLRAPLAGPHNDAGLHAIFVGFVLGMVFGHAPIVVPAVIGRRLRFDRAFYVPLALLHGALATRVAGDLVGGPPLVQVGAAGTVAALLALGAALVRGLMRGGSSST